MDLGVDDWGEMGVGTRVERQLATFTARFAAVGASGHLGSILRDGEILEGPQVRQKREVFTSQYLVEPVLHALGFGDPMLPDFDTDEPHFVRQPTTFETVDRKRPDYYLRNTGPDVVCFVEAKAANREAPDTDSTDAQEYREPTGTASADVQEYLDDDTFRSLDGLEHPNARYLVGIATDGLHWTFHAMDLETGDRRTDPTSDITPVVEAVARRHDHLNGAPDVEWNERVERLTAELVPAFEASRIGEHARRILT